MLVVRREGEAYAEKYLASGRPESRVVPGFWIEVDWLWRDRLPSTLVCLREILPGSL